jgi:hypothetical protein
MRISLSCLLLWLTLHGLALPADQAARPDLPKVVLVGDSIRLGYATTVEKDLSGRATCTPSCRMPRRVPG